MCRNAREFSRLSIGVVRAGGFRNDVPIAKDRCILLAKKVRQREGGGRGGGGQSQKFSGKTLKIQAIKKR